MVEIVGALGWLPFPCFELEGTLAWHPFLPSRGRELRPPDCLQNLGRRLELGHRDLAAVVELGQVDCPGFVGH
jgi:hypothetical protein